MSISNANTAGITTTDSLAQSSPAGKTVAMSKAGDFGVQSYSFRQCQSNPDVAKKVRELGLDKIEICGVHADFNHPSGFREVVQIYADAGISIISLGVQTFQGAARERDWFECASLAGAGHISAHFQVDTFPAAIKHTQKLCEEFGVRVGVHCHGGGQFGGSPDVLEHLMQLGAPQIGLCLDTAWCLQIGPLRGRPVDWAKKYAGKLYGIHFKDFIFGRNGQWTDVVVGDGNLDLPVFIKELDDGGFDGIGVIEYEADPENPVPALKKCVQALRRSCTLVKP
jgi:sugar phosphate isomerase/epimerase